MLIENNNADMCHSVRCCVIPYPYAIITGQTVQSLNVYYLSPSAVAIAVAVDVIQCHIEMSIAKNSHHYISHFSYPLHNNTYSVTTTHDPSKDITFSYISHEEEIYTTSER